MFNIAVINIKDIGKIAVKIFVALFFIVFLIMLLNQNISQNIKIDYFFNQCFDICVPGLKQIEFEKQEGITLSKLLSIELPVKKYVIDEKKDLQNVMNEIQNTGINEVQNYKISIPADITTEVLQSNVPESYTDQLDNVNIKNGTDFDLTSEMLSNVEFKNSKKILIYHTHTSESYTPSEAFQYEMTGNYRTTNLNYTVARVGKELESYLKTNGFEVIHDETCYDYPSYDASYDRAYESVTDILENNPDIEIIFDIHRDAIADSSYAPTVKIGDEYAAQLMFVMGTNGGGLEHPNWIQNLSFAIAVQNKANEKYPGLFKPIILRDSRYNQNLAKGACLIEVGATGNTLEQCNTSMKYLADVLKDVL